MTRSYAEVGRADAPASGSVEAPVPGKRTLTESLPVQRRAAAASAPADDAQATAADGVAGPGEALPFVDQIAASFGPAHADTVRGISAHRDAAAARAAQDLGAQAYATGNAVAFAAAPDLHLAAHEAAHVVQQRQGVSLKGGVGAAGDVYEQHADAVADRVVAGRSAGDLLGGTISAASADHPMDAVQLQADGSTPGMIFGNIVSVTEEPFLGGCDVVIDVGSKDGVQLGMDLQLHWKVAVMGRDAFAATYREVSDHTVKAYVVATPKDLERCDKAIFRPAGSSMATAGSAGNSPSPAPAPTDPWGAPQPQSGGGGLVHARITSKTPGPDGATTTVVIDRGAKDGVRPGMTVELLGLGDAIGSDGFFTESYEVTDATTVAHVPATAEQLARCDSAAIF
jgi:hypothetical protein